MKRNFFIVFIFLGATAILYAQDEGNAAVLREIPQIPDLFLLNTALDMGFGNIAGEDYEFSGKNGRGYIKPGFDVVKAFGPFALVGQLYDTIGLSGSDSYNALDIKLTPLFVIPQANLLVGAQFSGYFPFHEGRLIEDIAQAPKDSSFMTNIATLGILPGIQYTRPLPFGALYGSFLFITNKPVTSNDWTVQGDFEVGIKTGLGLSAFASPLFTFLAAGESPDPVYTALELQLAYAKNPVSAGVTVTLPGAQEDAYKNYGMNISTRFQYTFKSNLEVWGSFEFRGIGNGVDNDIVVVPALGTKYYIPLMNYLSPASREESRPSVPAGISGETGSAVEEEASPGKAPPHWHIGLSGGYANNSLYTSTGGRPLTEYESGHGLELGIPVRYQFSPWFAVQAELRYIQKNYTWRRTGQYDKVYSTVTNSFIDIPLMVNLSLGGEKLKVFANTGGYAGLWIDSRRKGTQIENTQDPFSGAVFYYDYDEPVEFDDRRDARFEAGLLAGLGLQYAFKPCAIFLEGRYYYGLTDLQQDYGYNMIPRMKSTFALTMGVLFNHNFIKSLRERK
ncbi:MAG: PorT family protein [Spirochaetaceae bacterium]|nr:PorT family protein [Spirochaetaceae bacterium]